MTTPLPNYPQIPPLPPWRRSTGRPTIGTARATTIPARLPPDLLERLREIRRLLGGPQGLGGATDSDAIRYAVGAVRLPSGIIRVPPSSAPPSAPPTDDPPTAPPVASPPASPAPPAAAPEPAGPTSEPPGDPDAA